MGVIGIIWIAVICVIIAIYFTITNYEKKKDENGCIAYDPCDDKLFEYHYIVDLGPVDVFYINTTQVMCLIKDNYIELGNLK